MNRILGIDLGSTAIKAVAIEGSFRNHQLRGYREEPLGPEYALLDEQTAGASTPSGHESPTPLHPSDSPGSSPDASGSAPSHVDGGEASTSGVAGNDSDSATSTEDGDEAPAGPVRRTWEERALDALQALADDGWLEAGTVVCALPSSQVATHLVTLPFHDARRVEQTLPFELEELIPFDIDEVIFDYQVLSREPGKAVLMVTVARKESVKATLDLLAQVGVDPNVVTFSAAALIHLFSGGYVPLLPPKPVADEDGDEAEVSADGDDAEAADQQAAPRASGSLLGRVTGKASAKQDGASSSRKARGKQATEPRAQAIVDIGAERTNIVIAVDGELGFARTVCSAGADVTRALSRGLGGVPFDEAEQFKHGIDLSGGDPTLVASAERAVATLVRDIRATFAAFTGHAHMPVEHVTLCGGGSRLEGLAPLLTDALGIPVEVVEYQSSRPFPEPDLLASGALALALGLHGAGGSRRLRLSFRRGEFVFTRDVSGLRIRTRALVAMAASLVLLFGLNTWAKSWVLASQEARLDSILCETTEKILGTCETDYRVALGKLQGQGSPAASIPSVSAVDLARITSKLFPADKDAVLADLDIVDNSVRLRGDAADYDVVEDVVAEIQKNPCFSEVRKGRMVKQNNRIEFDLDAQYTCNQPDSGGAGS